MIINWYVTPHCNLRCLYCSTDNFVHESETVLTGRDFLDVAHQIREFAATYPLCLSVLGGEPFIHPDFLKALKIVSDGCEIEEVFTNGTFLTLAIMDQLRDVRLRKLYVSLDSLSVNSGLPPTRIGLDEDTVNRVIETLRTFVFNRDHFRGNQPLIVIAPVLTQFNRSGIVPMVELCNRWGFGIEIQTLYWDFGRARCHSELRMSVTDEIDTLLDFAYAVCINPLLYADVSDQSSLVLAYLNKQTGQNILPLYDQRCEFFKGWPPYPYACIKWDGTVIPCSYDDRPFKAPSLVHTRLIEVFRRYGNEFQTFLADIRNRSRSPHAICQSCYFYNTGSCMPCPLPSPADLRYKRCAEVKKRDASLYATGI